jgi:hypothetical protein
VSLNRSEINNRKWIANPPTMAGWICLSRLTGFIDIKHTTGETPMRNFSIPTLKPVRIFSLILIWTWIFPGPIHAAHTTSLAPISQVDSNLERHVSIEPVWTLLASQVLLPLTLAHPTKPLTRMDNPGLPDNGFSITATDPISNALNVPLTSTIQADFSSALDTSTVTTATFVVHGGFTGRLDGAFSFSNGDTHLQLDPNLDFKPGEKFQLSATSEISSSLDIALLPGVINFTAAASVANAVMTAPPISPTFGAGDSHSLALGDLDGDGDLDVVIVNFNAVNNVWLNNGSGGFSPHPSTPTFGASSGSLSNGQDVALGDLDGDGDLDAVIANSGVGAETVWLNDGSGSFSAQPTTPTFGGRNSIAIDLGDLDGDGDLDAVVANIGSDPESVWLNNGAGIFTSHPITPTFEAGEATDITLGDLDGDADLDAVIATYNQTESVWINNGIGGFSPNPAQPTFGSGYSYAVALGDIDSDGDLDAVFANYIGQAEHVWVNDGQGVFSPHPVKSTFGGGYSLDIALGDLDGDGDLDAAVVNGLDGAETVWLNDGSGIFDPHPTTPSFGSGTSFDLGLGDLDGDGDLDAVVSNGINEAETVWLNNLYLIYLPTVVK